MAGAKECYDIETGRLERERKKKINRQFAYFIMSVDR